MEGTRNERVAILLTSYLIGFITAYIAFGVVQLEESVKFVQLPDQNMASIIAAREEVLTTQSVYIAVDKEGLVLIKDGERILLSSNTQGNSNEFLLEGQHVAISDYSLSNNKEYVYFCELPSSDLDSCRPYIYSIAETIVYPVTVNGERVAFDAEGQEVSWSEDGELIF